MIDENLPQKQKEHERPAITCESVDPSKNQFNKNYAPMVDVALKAFSSIFSTLPPKDTFRVAFSPETMEGLRDGTLKWLKSGKAEVINAKTGHFKEIPIRVANISPAQIASLAFTAGSVIFGQMHLARINKKLSDIKNVADQIREDQQDKDFSNLTGVIRWLKNSFFPAIQERAGDEEWRISKRTNLDNCQKELNTYQDDLQRKVSRTKRKVDELLTSDGKIADHLDPWEFGTKTAFKTLSELGEDIQCQVQKYDLLFQASTLVNLAFYFLDQGNMSDFLVIDENIGGELKASSEKLQRVSRTFFENVIPAKKSATIDSWSSVGPLNILSPLSALPLGPKSLIAAAGSKVLYDTDKNEARNRHIIQLTTSSLSNIQTIHKNNEDAHEKIKQLDFTPSEILVSTDEKGNITSGKVLLPRKEGIPAT